METLDFIGAIELAYDRSLDEVDWLAKLAQKIGPAFNPGSTPTWAFVFDFGGEHQQPATARAPLRVVYDCDPFTTLKRVIGDDAQRTIAAAGMKGDDALGLRGNMSPECGVMFTALIPARYRIRHRDLWMRFAAHVGAALRLRRRKTAAPSPEGAQAVLRPDGRLEHSTTAAVVDARAELETAAKDMDRARGTMRRLDPEAASGLWRTMVKSEWSLVDWFDSDGKRYLLAQDNRVPSPAAAVTSKERKRLSDRERQIVACAAMGHSNKLIAYDLGLSTGTVSVLLRRAATKLGVGSRVALIRSFREGVAG